MPIAAPFASENTTPFEVHTALGSDALVLRAISGEERISGLYCYALELVAEDNSIDLAQMVGNEITVSMPRPDGTEQFLHGIAGRFAYAGTNSQQSVYHACLYPELWLLTLSSQCRIFQNQTVEQIIDQILQEAGITAVIKNLSGSYQARVFCVQYRETNFDFLSRLMEEEGIFYFFRHEFDKHTLILADNPGAGQAATTPVTVHWRDSDTGWDDEDTISECSVEDQTVTERYKTSDYNFEMPDTDLFTSIGPETARQEIYEYPANALSLDDVETKARRMLELLSSSRRILRGVSSCRALRPGVRFTFTGHSREDLNTDYIVRSVSFRTQSDGSFKSSFEAYPAATPHRPLCTTQRPRIHGTQTAIVVGKPGDEIMTDAYGRVRVHFHWDRSNKRDENASCPVRVAQVWAGKRWGSLFVPRVGQEVIISFLDGDPDRPMIIGSVYNAAQPAPFDPGAEPTKTGFRSNSPDGFNEICFEDKKDAEELYFRAQKNFRLDVGSDETARIGHDQIVNIKNSRSISVDEGDDSVIVKKGNRTVTVENGNETRNIKGSSTLTIGGGDQAGKTQADYTINVEGSFVLNVKGNITLQTAEGAISIKGSKIENTAGQVIVSKAGTTQTVEGGESVSIKGPLVKLN